MSKLFFDNFEKIWIINLPHRMDRRREMEQQLRRVGIAADDPRIRFFPAVRPENADGFPTIGARGCFMSHLAVLREIQLSDVKLALLLEDDCNFDLHAIEELPNQIPFKNYMLYGGALNEIELKSPAMNGYAVLPPGLGIMGSHFIATSSTLAKELVEYFEKMLIRPPGDPDGGPMHVDGAYSWYRKAHPECVTVLAVPEIAYQRSSATDIHESGWSRKLMLPTLAVNVLRKIRNFVRQNFR